MENSGYLKEKISTYLDNNGKLKSYPAKRRPKLYALCYLSTKLVEGVKYTEEDINLLLLDWHMFNDPATLRREMYNLMLLNRTSDGKIYELNPDRPTAEYLIDKYCK